MCWAQASKAALALFKFGQQEAAKRGLLLVDTKYEFGKDAEGNIMLIDEIHTPDSSRYVKHALLLTNSCKTNSCKTSACMGCCCMRNACLLGDKGLISVQQPVPCASVLLVYLDPRLVHFCACVLVIQVQVIHRWASSQFLLVSHHKKTYVPRYYPYVQAIPSFIA
jgi:hypothetical protein